MKSGSRTRMMPPNHSVVNIARLASPVARSSPVAHMPRPRSGVVGRTMPGEDRGGVERVAGRAEQREHRADEGQAQKRRDAGDEDEPGERRARHLAGMRPVLGAQRPGDERGRRDHHPDRQRDEEEDQRRGVADGGGQARVVEERDVEEVEEIDQEDGDEADRAGRGQHQHVPHGRAGGVARLRSGGGLARHAAVRIGGAEWPAAGSRSIWRGSRRHAM